ncbi:hypothetical protein [Dactylosporangium sp. NPDC000521]|uniref:hypothetical protein n=1 Tax=Dactylosporangium sp. NPDC000521 TaxID=3363975 RepID=UPI0036AB64C9
MPAADLTLDRWCALDQRAAELLAAAVARAVGGESLGVGWPRSHAPALRVARIAVDGTEFVLVPGGPARLGFDAGRFEPADAEVRSFFGDHDALRSWRGVPPERPAATGPLPGQLGLFETPAPARRPRTPAGDADVVRAHVAARVTAPRTAVLPALLVAAEATQAGVTEVAPDHPVVREHLRRHGPPARGVIGMHDAAGDHDSAVYARIELDRLTGVVRRCWTAGPAGYDEVVTGLATAGRRLLTPDEWEYACGLGRGTLFAWGDRMPAPRDRETPTGLRLGDMYWPELTSVRTEVRGGDFGVLGCGGETEFHHSLLRAPAFRDPEIVAAEAGVPSVRRRRFRAAIEVPPGVPGR